MTASPFSIKLHLSFIHLNRYLVFSAALVDIFTREMRDLMTLESETHRHVIAMQKLVEHKLLAKLCSLTLMNKFFVEPSAIFLTITQATKSNMTTLTTSTQNLLPTLSTQTKTSISKSASHLQHCPPSSPYMSCMLIQCHLILTNKTARHILPYSLHLITTLAYPETTNIMLKQPLV